MGVMLQLGQRSSDRDVWRESNKLNFVEGRAAGDMQFLPVSPDFISNFHT
jgi:hypothetical protein